MRRVWPGLVVAGALLAGAPQDAVKQEKEKLQGAWSPTEITERGKKGSLDVRIEFKGDKVTLTPDGKTAVMGTYAIDPAKSPPTLDITLERGGKQVVLLAIYQVKGDELTFCHALGSDVERPTAFEATDKTLLATFKRQKP